MVKGTKTPRETARARLEEALRGLAFIEATAEVEKANPRAHAAPPALEAEQKTVLSLAGASPAQQEKE